MVAFTQRNMSYENQKANAINIMATAVTDTNCSFVEAAKRVTDCCGFNPETMWVWASSFLTAATSYPIDDMAEGDCLNYLLYSNHRHHNNHADSLFNNEDFCLAARTFICKHACKKGEPNLTCHMFCD